MTLAAEIHAARCELDDMRGGAGPSFRIAQAATFSVLLAAWGSAIVLLGRHLDHPETVTLVAHPVLAVVLTIWLLARGATRESLGLRLPRSPTRLHRQVLLAFAALGLGLIVVALVRRPALSVARLVFGTAGGEEVLHRSVLLGVWSRTDATPRVVVAANAITFGAWHIGGAVGSGPRTVLEIAVPLLGAPLFCLLRLRLRSVIPAWLAHLVMNAAGLAISR
jgi:membrane protease YdiL (CAAX protease family)